MTPSQSQHTPRHAVTLSRPRNARGSVRRGGPSGALKRLRGSSAGLASTAAGNMLSLALGLVTGVLTARLLSPNDRGVLVGVLVWNSTIAYLALGGLNDALTYRARGSVAVSLSLRRAFRRVLFVYGSVGVAASAFIAVVIARESGPAATTVALACSAMIPLHAYTQLRLVPLWISGRFALLNILRPVPATVYAVGLFALASLGLLSVTSALVCLSAGSVVAAIIYSRLDQRATIPVTDQKTEVRSLRKYGMGVVLAGIPYLANQRLDQLLLGLLAAPSKLGVYAVAVSVASVLQIIGTTFEQILFPRFSARRDRSGIVLAPTLAVVCGITAAVGAVAAILAEPLIVAVYGPAYAGAVTSVYILVVGVVAQSASAVLSAEAKALGRLRHLTRAHVAGVVVTVVMLPAMVPVLGILGAAITSTGSYLVTAGFLFVFRGRPSPSGLGRATPGSQGASPAPPVYPSRAASAEPG